MQNSDNFFTLMQIRHLAPFANLPPSPLHTFVYACMHACMHENACAHTNARTCIRTCAYLIFPVNNRLDTFTLVCHYAVSGLAQSAHIKSEFGARKHGNGPGFISRSRVCGALIYEISSHNHVGRANAAAGEFMPVLMPCRWRLRPFEYDFIKSEFREM